MTSPTMRQEAPLAAAAAAPDIARDLARAERVAKLLDSRFQIAGISFGWDAIVGLVPVAGDIATAAIALYPIHLAHRHKLGRLLIARMLANVAMDVVVGAVPVLGDIFDVAWKANYRNFQLFLRAVKARGGGGA